MDHRHKIEVGQSNVDDILILLSPLAATSSVRHFGIDEKRE